MGGTDQALEAAFETARDIEPMLRGDVQSLEDRQEGAIDGLALVLAQDPPGPVHQIEVIGNPKGQPLT